MDANELAKDIYEAIVNSVITGIDEGAFVPVVADMIRQRGNGWKSVKERLPEEGIYVTTYSAKSGIGYGFNNKRLGWWVVNRTGIWGEKPVTHWQPLPPAPEGER